MKKGWKVEKLGDVLQKTETVNPTQKPNHEFMYVDVSSVNNQTYSIENASLLKGKDAPSRARKLIKAGDVIFATVRPTLKRVAIIPDEFDGQVCSTGYFVLRAKEFISNKYLFYFLLSDEFMEKMENLQKGASYPAVTDNEVRSQMIAYPSLPEQERIVALLDETFAGLAQVRVNAERNLVNAREVFEAVLRETFNNGKDWEEKYLEDLGQITSSKRIYKSEYVNDGVPFYRIKEIKELANNQDISVELYISRKRYQEIKNIFGVPKGGDILMTAVGTIGEIYVVGNDDEFYFKDGNVLWFKDFDSVDPYFLKYALQFFVEQIKRLSIGAAYKAVTIEKIEKHKVYIPLLAEQRAIVKRLDALAGETSRLEAVYQQKIDAVEELRKSLLRKAFEGEL